MDSKDSMWEFDAPRFYKFPPYDCDIDEHCVLDDENMNIDYFEKKEKELDEEAKFASKCPFIKKPTIPVTPKFAKIRQRSNKEIQKTNCANRLIKIAKTRVNNVADKKPKQVKNTIPQPFHFHGKNKKMGNSIKIETLAEGVMKFSKETPQRFRLKNYQTPTNFVKLKPTKPKTPKFVSKSRPKPSTVLSHDQKEELEIQEAQRMQFKATELDRKIFENPKLPSKPPAKPTVVVKEFNLSKPKKKVESLQTEEVCNNFVARPIPLSIYQELVKSSDKMSVFPTVPQSPAFSKLHATKKKMMLLNSMDQSISSDISKEQIFVPKKTQVMPFSFDGKDKEVKKTREKLIKEEERKEKEARKFIARPMYDLSNTPVLPSKKVRPVTKIEPFELVGEKRAEENHKKWQEKLEQIEKEQHEMKEFKAKPALVLKQAPFVPEIPDNQGFLKTLVEIKHIPNHTTKRLEKRKKWEEHIKEKELEAEKENMKRKEEERLLEEEEIKMKRMQTVHHAEPIRYYSPIRVLPSKKLLTDAHSPNFSERISQKYLDKTLKLD